MLSWRLTNCTTTLGHHSKTRLGSLYIGITGESIRLKYFPELQNLNFIISCTVLAFIFVRGTNLEKNLKLQSLVS